MPPVELEDTGVTLEQINRGKEAPALQAIAIEIVRSSVGGGDQRETAGEERIQETVEQHGVRDICHQELVETEDADLLAQAPGDDLQRIGLLGQTRHPLMHVAHEVMKMDAARARQLEILNEPVHQVGLAATDTAPEIESGNRGHRAAAPTGQASD